MAPIPAAKPVPRVPPKPAKAKNVAVSVEFLTARTERARALGFAKPRWVEFCEVAMRRGFAVSLYEARHTASKYITLRSGGKAFKVRFSDHRPNASRERAGDCDFFVGVTHLAVTTTGDALRAVAAYFGEAA